MRQRGGVSLAFEVRIETGWRSHGIDLVRKMPEDGSFVCVEFCAIAISVAVVRSSGRE